MLTVKDTQRATVQVCFDGSVRKAFHGAKAEERFTNEVRVLQHLEQLTRWQSIGFLVAMLAGGAFYATGLLGIVSYR
jgi:hypothetical protein